jgi:hypothetical protein
MFMRGWVYHILPKRAQLGLPKNMYSIVKPSKKHLDNIIESTYRKCKYKILISIRYTTKKEWDVFLSNILIHIFLVRIIKIFTSKYGHIFIIVRCGSFIFLEIWTNVNKRSMRVLVVVASLCDIFQNLKELLDSHF